MYTDGGYRAGGYVLVSTAAAFSLVGLAYCWYKKRVRKNLCRAEQQFAVELEEYRERRAERMNNNVSSARSQRLVEQIIQENPLPSTSRDAAVTSESDGRVGRNSSREGRLPSNSPDLPDIPKGLENE